MNEVKKCSISGISFLFEVDAYAELSAYLEELRKQYKGNPDGEEIIADIEARIAELILSTQDNGRAVALPLVKNIIAQMGSAAEIEEESSTAEEPKAPQPHSEQPRIPRRLYRDAEGGKLGGVCAGLANYFDIDPVWVRLIFFLPLISSLLFTGCWAPYWLNSMMQNLMGVFALGYLIMWFAVPAARSARQKLEMKGEKITADSIRSNTASRSDVDGRSKAAVADTVSTLARVVTILLKLFAGAVLMGLILMACGLIIGAFAVVASPDLISPHWVEMWVALFAVLAVLVPCLLLIYVLLCLIASRRPNGKVVGFTFLAWVVIVFLLIFSALRAGLHRDILNEVLPSPTYNGLNLLNDPEEAVEEAVERYEDALEEHVEQLVEQTGQGQIRVSMPEGEIDLKVDEAGLKIDVKERVQ